jgi:hypothetical protein
MKWSDLSKAIGRAAPLLGSALGGPVGGAVGAVISSALGVDNTPDAVAAAIKADPSIAIKLREIESQNEASLRDYQFKVLDAELKDVQNARDIHRMSFMPAAITISMTILSMLYGASLFNIEFPEANRDMINTFGGQLLTLWVGSVVYWIGTTRSSAEKNRILTSK